MADSRWRVLVSEAVDTDGLEPLAEVADIDGPTAHRDDAHRRAEIDKYDGLIVRTFQVDAEVLEKADRLRVVSKHGTGLDNIDVAAASEQGIAVCNTPGVNSAAVAEHAFGLVIAARKQICAADRDLRAGEWDRERYLANELRDDTLGLFGCGTIGIEVAERALAFGMDVVAFDPYIDPDACPSGVSLVADKQELFRRADAVSVHAPLTDETAHAIGAREFEALAGGPIVNTARGEIIDQDALVAALDSGVISSAGLDVFESEPPDPSHPLFARDNVVVTPHIAGGSREAMFRMSHGAATHVGMVLEGRLPDDTVNREALEWPASG